MNSIGRAGAHSAQFVSANTVDTVHESTRSNSTAHPHLLTWALLSSRTVDTLNAKETEGNENEKRLARDTKEAVRRGHLQASSGQLVGEIAQFKMQQHKDTLVVQAKLNEESEYDVLRVDSHKGSAAPISMLLPLPSPSANVVNLTLRPRSTLTQHVISKLVQSAYSASVQQNVDDSDDELVPNFTSRGRSKLAAYPSERCTTPDEQSLLVKQRASDKAKEPEDISNFQDAILDYVSGDKEDDTLEFIASEINKFAVELSPIQGKQIFRGIACYSDKIPELSDFRSWDLDKNLEITKRLIHSAEFAPNTAGDYGLASTTTAQEIASEFASSRQEINANNGIASQQAILNIFIEPTNPPKGYALEDNYPFGENNLSLHEIQLSKDDNNYRITDLEVQNSGISNIFILASGTSQRT